MTLSEKRLVAVALVVAERWEEMYLRRQGVATDADARAMLALVKVAKAYKREQRGAAR